jgi:hypothetical protein
MNTSKKLATFIAVGALTMNAFVPTALAADVTDISGNGSFSSNSAVSSDTHSSSVVQNNDSSITNAVSVSSNTGGNAANDNTGGSTFVSTGDTSARVRINNMSNLNQVSDPMGSSTSNSDPVSLTGNGSGSSNTASNLSSNTSSIFQHNTSDTTNTVGVAASTGNNEANRNTGGDVTVLTGHSVSDIGINNSANVNWAGVTADPRGIKPLASDSKISGNGAASFNSISESDFNSSSIVQDNAARMFNAVTLDQSTGLNRLNDNTGGSVAVGTGVTQALLGISNMANLNMAQEPNGMNEAGNNTSITGNGALSTNAFSHASELTDSVFQGGGEGNGNLFDVTNALSALPTTGDNLANRNTLQPGNDTTMVTGFSLLDTNVKNVGNANIFGQSMSMPSDTQVNFGFDLGAILGSLHF